MIFANYFLHGTLCAVVCGTVLQAESSPVQFPMLSLYIFVEVILPAALGLCGRIRL